MKFGCYTTQINEILSVFHTFSPIKAQPSTLYHALNSSDFLFLIQVDFVNSMRAAREFSSRVSDSLNVIQLLNWKCLVIKLFVFLYI